MRLVSAEKANGYYEYNKFDMRFKLWRDLDALKITARCVDDVLIIILPKKIGCQLPAIDELNIVEA